MKRIFAALLLTAAGTVLADGHPVTLWQAKGTNNSVYLLGSIHLLREQDYPLPDVFESAYQDAESIVMELDMDDLDPFATQALFTEYGVLQDETTLADLLGEQDFAAAKAMAEEQNIPLHMLLKVEPWYAAVTVEVIALSRIGFNPTLGIESWVTNKAANDGKEIEGLETAEEQISILDGLSPTAQREMLLSSLEESATLDELMDLLIAAWRQGDIALLEAEMLKPMLEYEELYEAILVERNNRWMDRIVALLDDDEDYLVVVGALHLIGEDGVPQQLEARGIEVRQLSETAPLR